MQGALDHLEQNRQAYLDLLFDFLRIPSVSAQSDYHDHARRAAEFVRARLEQAGFEAGLFEGNGLPTVHGKRIEDPSGMLTPNSKETEAVDPSSMNTSSEPERGTR